MLSLFFIDKVANYRVYKDDGTTSLGKIGQWFEEAYKEFSEKPRFRGVVPYPVEDVHDGYFSKDIDEPQSVDNTPKAKGAITRLNPVVIPLPVEPL